MGNHRYLSTRRVNASLWVELKKPPVNADYNRVACLIIHLRSLRSIVRWGR